MLLKSDLCFVYIMDECAVLLFVGGCVGLSLSGNDEERGEGRGGGFSLFTTGTTGGTGVTTMRGRICC